MLFLNKTFLVPIVRLFAVINSVSFRRDFCVLTGLGMIFYGLNLYSPAIAFTICGALVLSGGVLGYVFGGE